MELHESITNSNPNHKQLVTLNDMDRANEVNDFFLRFDSEKEATNLQVWLLRGGTWLHRAKLKKTADKNTFFSIHWGKHKFQMLLKGKIFYKNKSS